MVAYKTNLSEDSISRWQRTAIGRLANILFEWEMDARRARAQAIEAQLPPPSYTQLFGIEDAKGQLLGRLMESNGPGVVAIVGIGGIGKTALADAVTRQIANQLWLKGVVWLRADPQTMSGQSLSPRLTFDILSGELAARLGLGDAVGSSEQRLKQIRQLLKGQPHLVIIDNLETDAETAYLVNYLHDLAEPSKFLLTARTRPPIQATVYSFELNEITFEDAASLVLRHGRDLGLSNLMQPGDESIRAIYNMVGGNPLALKLVVSLLDLLPLQQILIDLQKSRTGPIENLYRQIYWQTWRILSPEARLLLQAMPLVGESGGTPDYLQRISNLPADRFWTALQELRNRSLVEVRGTIQEKRFGIHRLTDSFLRTEIIQWPDD